MSILGNNTTTRTERTTTSEEQRLHALLTMLAARDIANLIVKHSLDLESHGATDAARKFDHHAAVFRGLERQAAFHAGVTED